MHRLILRLELPKLCDRAEPGYPVLHYEQFGALLSRRCHLLLALWDGLPAAAQGGSPARGSTGDVVRMRREGEHAVGGFGKSPLFAGAGSRLDLSPGGPVPQVVTPRNQPTGAVHAAGQGTPKPGDCFLLPGGEGSTADPKPAASVVPSQVIAALSDEVQHDFAQIVRLNQQIRGFGKLDRSVFDTQLDYLPAPNARDPFGDPLGEANAHLERLRQWQAAADTAAQAYQRRLLGQFVPAESFREMLANGWKQLCNSRRPPRPGVLFGFVAAVPIATLLFETYAHLGRSPWALGFYLTLFAGSIAYYRFRVGRHEWQNRFQDYRALAEAMRVQLFWALAATPAAASDNYLRKQSGELGWIPFALRAPALWAAALALALKQPQRQMVTHGWIEHQQNFFTGAVAKVVGGKAGLNKRAAERGKHWARLFLFGGLGVALVLAAIEVLRLALQADGVDLEILWPGLHHAQDWLLVLAATAPALAVFFTVSVDLRAYEAHAHSYALMGRIFQRARREATRTSAATDDREFQALVRELGREALAENAEWLLDHRHRPIEHRV